MRFSHFSEKSGKYNYLSDRKIAELSDDSELQRKYENSDNSELYDYLSGPLSENSDNLKVFYNEKN